MRVVTYEARTICGVLCTVFFFLAAACLLVTGCWWLSSDGIQATQELQQRLLPAKCGCVIAERQVCGAAAAPCSNGLPGCSKVEVLASIDCSRNVTGMLVPPRNEGVALCVPADGKRMECLYDPLEAANCASGQDCKFYTQPVADNLVRVAPPTRARSARSLYHVAYARGCCLGCFHSLSHDR